MKEMIRRVRLSPYRKGQGPTFALTVWRTGMADWRGQSRLAYALTMREGTARTILFAGDDFSGSPLHADDSDATLAALLGFLTLRPGDTDEEYFEQYTDVQRQFCEQHAEALSCESVSRCGEH